MSALGDEVRQAVQQALREELPRLLAQLQIAHASPAEPLVDVDEAARRLGLAKSTVYRLAQSCEIASVKAGRRLLFRAADLDAFTEARRRSPGQVRDLAQQR